MTAWRQVVGARGLGAMLGITGVCLSVLGCERSAEPPGVRPSEFVALRIYDVDTSREVVPHEAHLIRVAHADIGADRTHRVSKHLRYRKREPSGFWIKRLRHYAVARTSDGREHGLSINFTPSFLAIEGQRGCYYVEGASLEELDRIRGVALGRVFIPRRRRPAISEPGVPVVVKRGDKYGYADESGKVVIEARFDDATPFSEGLAAVRVGGPEHGNWGYIDGTGDFVIQPQFAGASFFSEGLAAVTTDDFFDGKQGYINREGAMVIESRFEEAWPFDGGTAVVTYRRKPGDATEVRHINAKGEFVDPPGPP
jgi:hypothetical protein